MCFCFSLCWHVLFVFVATSVSLYMRCHPPLIVIPISLGGETKHRSYLLHPHSMAPNMCFFPNIQQFLRVDLYITCIITYIYIYTYLFIYLNIHTRMYIYIYIRTHVHVRVFHYVLIHIP